jgi:hypothetical protein
MKIIIKEEDWVSSKYKTKKWEESVIITYWEHNYKNKTYTIKFNKKYIKIQEPVKWVMKEKEKEVIWKIIERIEKNM